MLKFKIFGAQSQLASCYARKPYIEANLRLALIHNYTIKKLFIILCSLTDLYKIYKYAVLLVIV